MVRWRDSRRSSNVEDRRGRGGVAIGGIGLLVVLVLGLLFGVDPRALLEIASGPSATTESGPPPADDESAQFVSAILASTEDVWSELFAAEGSRYDPPRLVLYEDRTTTGCGLGSAATGPFYCPRDQTVYLDLGFFRELARMGGPGDFAAAYVVGHEVGHHVQNLIGLRAPGVPLELQADCFAGLWANHANRSGRFLEPGDVEEGLAAAAAIGDDRLQRQAGRAVNPETFTHGSSAQRRHWLETGLETGRLESCDTSGV